MKKKQTKANPKAVSPSENNDDENSTVVQIEERWAGPLPPPSILSEYSEVVDNGAERLMAAWEKETAHRHKMEEQNLKWSIRDAIFGKICALIFVLTALAVSAYAAGIGAEWFATILGGGTIASVVWAFVKSSKK